MLNLPALFITPYVAALLILFFYWLPAVQIKRLGVLLSFITLIQLILGGGSWLGGELNLAWMPALGVRFHLQIDELSWLFLALTAVIIPISLAATPVEKMRSPWLFFAFALLLQGVLVGFFCARDLILFTVFWESMLLPLYFMIAIWGSSQRQAAALKFLIYMIAGSCLMVAAVLALYFAQLQMGGEGSFAFEILAKTAAGMPSSVWVGTVFILAFAVKTPLFPFHAWLPDAYSEAPIGGTILLSALLSKAGVYGFLRIGVEFFPQVIQAWSPLLIGLAIAGVLYGAFAAWGQNDLKRLVAYSSLSHVNLVLVAIFVGSQLGIMAGVVQAINHGLSIAALFLAVGWLQQRVGTLSLNAYGGIASSLPNLCWLTLFFVLSAVALPGLNNFVGEWLTFVALFAYSPKAAAVLILTVIFTAIYLLRWMEKVYFGTPKTGHSTYKDIGPNEFAIALPLILLILGIGLYPTPLIEQITPVTRDLIANAEMESAK